ncbi:MAG: Maf family protein [Myxococcota bacterium]
MSAFVLASRSPRRRDLLAAVGLHPEILASDIDERPLEGEAPIVYGRRVARGKAEACSATLPVLAADTVVALGDEIFAKAPDPAAAEHMLRRLAGHQHQVHTAVAWRPARDADTQTIVVTTQVTFRQLTDDEIRRYVATGEPMDKAGAYGIQGGGGALVAHVTGSYTNVVGLPLEETLTLMAPWGIKPC